MKDDSRSTDEDYESDEAEIDQLSIKPFDPKDDYDILKELLKHGSLKLFSNADPNNLIEAGCTALIATTLEEGPLAALFLSDQPDEECNDKHGMESFLFMTTGYEVSPLTTLYLNLMLIAPGKEGTVFEPLI